MLAHNDRQLDGHGVTYHKDGFGSPVGNLKGFNANPETMSDGELSSRGIETGKTLLLEFNSGVRVEGYLAKITRKHGDAVVVYINNCTVMYQEQELFNPGWGTYDMAVGNRIISAYAGPADPDAYGLQYPAPAEKTHHLKHTESTSRLHDLYKEVSLIRENGENTLALSNIWLAVKQHYPDEWLLTLEIAEICVKEDNASGILNDLIQYLERKGSETQDLKCLVEDGLKLLPINQPN